MSQTHKSDYEKFIDNKSIDNVFDEVFSFNVENSRLKDCHMDNEKVPINSFCSICGKDLCTVCANLCLNSKCRKSFCEEHNNYKDLCDHSAIDLSTNPDMIKCHKPDEITGYCNKEGCYKDLCYECSYTCMNYRCGLKYCKSHGTGDEAYKNCKHKILFKPLPKINPMNPSPFMKKIKMEKQLKSIHDMNSCLEVECNYRLIREEWFCGSRMCGSSNQIENEDETNSCNDKKCKAKDKKYHWCCFERGYVYGRNPKKCMEMFKEGKIIIKKKSG